MVGWVDTGDMGICDVVLIGDVVEMGMLEWRKGVLKEGVKVDKIMDFVRMFRIC